MIIKVLNPNGSYGAICKEDSYVPQAGEIDITSSCPDGRIPADFATNPLFQTQAYLNGKLLATMTTAIQNFLDQTANKYGYDSAERCATYYNDPDAVYSADGRAMTAWRSAVWKSATATQAAVIAGTQAVPTVDQLIAGLPPLTGMASLPR